ncbi:OmpA family protein [Flavobacterium pectinovorum]|uniref:Flagellar motor protein MotB n=1 Tax=Flavobacterium pectinovorum TaxID=29533 RepID=A0A502E149_9FLAO|nr:OmpA family protein [Flavobacterium pectinovorum]TPG31307.1 flagellar motor protein MotB [Flavobacterium pectinovorum]
MRKIYFIKLTIALWSLTINAQEGKIASAEKLFNKYAYIDAIETYQRVAEKGYKSADLFEKLGDAYYFNADFSNSVKWYTELFSLNEAVPSEYYYRYAQSLKAVGNYNKADLMMNNFLQKSGEQVRSKLYADNKDYLAQIKKNSGRYQISSSSINSNYLDYGAAFYGDKLVFTSTRDTGGVFTKRINPWTNQSFTTLYGSTIKGDSLLKPVKFSKNINSIYHEATPVFTKNGQTMYFTRNNINNGKVKKDNSGRVLFKIYRAVLVKDQWVQITELPFNSDNYSVAHPALSPDEKTLYFASDMPGTIGGSDIYKIAINEDGTFGKPENLGTGINTEARETFPFISANNELFFASDGHPGLGGLDIFVSVAEKDKDFKNAINVGEPINSSYDDFSYIIDEQTKKGYFSSNRTGGKGYDDIYSFTELKKLETDCRQMITGVVTDVDDKSIISGALVILSDAKFNTMKQITTGPDGSYSFEADCGTLYYIKAEKKQYATKEQSVTTLPESGETKSPISLGKATRQVTIGSDLAHVFDIELIYFDLDKHNIRKDAAIDLQKIIEVMNQYPKMKIDVRSYTDSRASYQYNQKLSDRRAESTIKYMIKNGIAVDRLAGRGYGETQLINKCTDGIKCTEKEHQLNRRSEFIITEM